MSESEVVPREVTQQRLNRGYARVMGYRRDQPYSVADMLEERARDAAQCSFIVFEGRAVSFAQLNASANRLAHAALAAGLAPGDVVALMMDNRPEFPMVWLALAKVGIVTALLNTAARGRVLKHALEQTGARALIYGSECAERVASLAAAERPALLFEARQPQDAHDPAARCLEAAMAQASEANPPRSHRAQVRLGDPLYYIFTSGTTGLPKAARMSHLRFLNAGGVIAGFLELTREDVLYNVLPLYHGAGGMVVVSAALHVGIPIVLKRRFSAGDFWDDVRRHHVTAWYYIGELCRYLLNQPPRADDRQHTLRRMSGAGLKAEVWRRFQERFGIEFICEGLGSTEANYGLTNVDSRVGSVGRLPYPERSNIRVVRYDPESGEYLRNPDGSLIVCQPGEVGELIAEVLDGPGAAGFFEGYTSPEATEAKLLRDVFRPGDRWVRSGDLVRHDAEDYFYFVDRVGRYLPLEGRERLDRRGGGGARAVFRSRRWSTSTACRSPVPRDAPGWWRSPTRRGCASSRAPSMSSPRRAWQATRCRFSCASLPMPTSPAPSSCVRSTCSAAGYDPARTRDELYVRDAQAGRYVPLSATSLAALGIAAFAGD